MAISARLSRVLHRQFGEGACEDFINWMSQMESNRSELRDMMDGYIALTNSRFAENDARMDAKFAAAEARTDARFATFEARMDARIDTTAAVLRGDVMTAIERARSDTIKWSFIFWCATMVVVATARAIW